MTTKTKTSKNKTCPECGMKKENWSVKDGVEREGDTYCCEGCANGTGCICG